MNPAILAYVLQGLQAIPTLIAAGQSVTGLVSHLDSSLKAMQAENRDPTADEWVALASTINDLRAQLHAPQSITGG